MGHELDLTFLVALLVILSRLLTVAVITSRAVTVYLSCLTYAFLVSSFSLSVSLGEFQSRNCQDLVGFSYLGV